MNHKKSLATRIWIVVLLAVILSTGSFCVVALYQTNTAIIRSTRQRMLDIVNCAAGSIDGDTLERLTKDSVNNPGYRRVYNALAVFRDNIEADSVYGIKAEDDGRFTFTIDPSLEEPGEFGEEVIKTDALVKASKGISAVDLVPYTDRWGTFYSAYSPVHNSSGEIVGIVAVDFSIDWYEGQLKEQVRRTLLLFLIVLGIVLLMIGSLCYILIRAITLPMKQITDTAQLYQNGDFSKKLEIDREDELGVLSRALQSMATALTEQIREADEANRAKSNFLANMSHEIRTPINAVLGMNEMILRESADPEIRLYSENVKTAGSTLLGIINDILDFSKIEAGKLELIPEKYDLSSVLNDLVNMVSPRVDAKGLELVLDFDPDTPKQLYGDAVRIKQIITNILTNAAKYTEQGSIVFHVGFSKTDNDPENVLLDVAVKDTGIGIREADVKKLFSEFERIEEKRNRNIEGTGLGMNITKNLLEMMGATLEVESIYGEGSNFHFSLKQKIVGNEVLGDYASSYGENHDKSEEYREKFTAPGAIVLVVDDNDMNLVVFKNLIKQTLIMVDTADSGDKALEMMRVKKYDIIFLDHMMPDKDGIMTLQEMKQEEDNPNLNTPTICLTANAISGARDEYIAAGFSDYLTKPIDTDSLDLMLMKHLPEELIEIVHSDLDDANLLVHGPRLVYKKLSLLIDQKLIDIDSGLNYCGRADVYLDLLKAFYNLADENIEELDWLYSNEDFENYSIKADVIKTSARIIGAIKLGEDAYRLEAAGKNGDYAYINRHHESFIKKYMDYKNLIAALNI
ncbi:response regulator [Butyrivibrio sp. AE3004]|uniref:response regulator n=1 Tax=Butyrivibrio sp. AE3004 TaxID=1506994 RepID=UPI00068A367A|nr:response regulator [Butyrivibrio sp. AE3004]